MIDNLTEAIRYFRQKARNIFLGETFDNYGKLADWLTELQERREADRWIPVSERLPDTDGRYLVLLEKDYAEDYSLPREQIENFEVEEGSFGVWHENYNMRTLGYLDSEWSAIPVTHWKPLPKAPESEDK